MINDIAVRLDLLKKRKRGAKFKYEEIKFYNDFLISMIGLYSCKNIEQLSAPVKREVLDNTVYWNEVSGANSYTIKLMIIKKNVVKFN